MAAAGLHFHHADIPDHRRPGQSDPRLIVVHNGIGGRRVRDSVLRWQSFIMAKGFAGVSERLKLVVNY